MGINIGDAVPKGVYVGDTKVSAVYVGDSKIRPISIGAPTGITATAGAEKVTIKWTDPADQTYVNWASSTLVRSTAHIPTSINDGTSVLTETTRNQYSSTGYDNTGLTAGTTYYYNVFATGDNGTITGGTGASATPTSSGWQPGANTLVYLPLNSTYQTTNLGTNGRAFASRGITWGSNYAQTTSYGNGIYSYQNSSYNTNYSTWTVNVWCNISSFSHAGHYGSQIMGINNYGDGDNKNLDTQQNYFVISNGNRYTANYNGYLNAWHNIVITSSQAYIDGSPMTIYQTGSNTTINTYNMFLLLNPRMSGSSYGVVGKISAFIFENKAWTQQEVSNYYNQTKSNYGIS